MPWPETGLNGQIASPKRSKPIGRSGSRSKWRHTLSGKPNWGSLSGGVQCLMASYTVDVRNCLAYLRKPSHSPEAETPCLPPRVAIHLLFSIGNINAPQVLAGASGKVKTPFQSVGAVGGIAMRAVV